MIKTEKLKLPIYNTPQVDVFDLEDWNIANTNLESAYSEMKEYTANENTRIASEISRESKESIRENQENTRKSNEILRVENEATRNASEGTRISKENERLSAEALRVSKETERVNSEATRVSKETTRESNEATRVSKEATRVADENIRKTNETARISKETERQNKETERLNAEAIRVTNETRREAELLASRTDFNGKACDTLDERLKSDMGYVEDRFNNSERLQYEDKYISAESSFNGVTKDLQIKGRTLKNLLGNDGNCEDLWSSGGAKPVLSNSIKLFGNKSIKTIINSEPSIITKDVLCDQTHKYFVSGYCYVESFTSGIINLGVRDYNAITNNTTVAFDTTKLNQWQRKSLIVTGKANGGLRVYPGANTSATATYYLDGFMVYDLTEIYGVGNEPTDIDRLERELPYVDSITSLKPIAMRSCGKNLFDLSKIVPNLESMLINGDKVLIKNSYATYGVCNLNKYLKPNTRYYISRKLEGTIPQTGATGRIALNNPKTNNIIVLLTGGYGSSPNGYFTTPSDIKEYYSLIMYGNSATTDIVFSDIIISEVETTYEPFVGDTITLPSNMELRALPNGVCDIADLEKGKVIQKVGNSILNGTENWNLVSTYTNTLRFQLNKADIKINGGITSSIFNEGTASFDIENIDTHSSISLMQITILKSRLITQDLPGFKTWLQANPVTVLYELATPIEVPIEAKNSLRTYDGKTNIFLETNELESNILAKIPTGTNEIFDARKSEVKGKTFGRVDDRIEEIEKEIKDANKDFNGTVHDNLNERLSSDINYINDRFNKSTLVEYTDFNISANESFDGITNGLNIKGRTFQNLATTKTIADTNRIKKANVLFDITQGKEYTLSFNVNKTLGLPVNIAVGSVGGSGVKSVNITSAGYYKIVLIGQYSSENPNYGKYVAFWSDNTPHDYVIDEITLLEGNYSTINIPSYVDGIKSVGEESNKVEVLSVGKNLLDLSKCTYGYRVNETNGNAIVANSVGATGDGYTDYIKVNLNVHSQIQFSCNNKPQYTPWACYDENKKYIKGSSGANTGILPSNTKYIRFTVSSQSTNEQLEHGVVATTYEPYKEDKINIELTEPLRSLLNGVTDEVDLENGKYIKNIGKVVLNGSENWVTQNNALTNVIAFVCPLTSANAKDYSQILSNNFKYLTGNQDEEHARFSNNSSLILFINKNRLSTQDPTGFKAWLQANPTTIYYELATQVETPLDLPNSLRTYDKATHILTQGSLVEPIVQAKIPSDVLSLTDIRHSTVKNKLFADADARVEELEQDVKKIVTQEAWITPTLVNGWVAVDGYPVKYMKDSLGFVHMKGRVSNGTMGNAMFVLPIGYRPSNTITLPMLANDVFSFGNVTSTGSFYPVTGTPTKVIIDSVVFRAEQ